MTTAPEDPWVQLKFRVRRSLHAKLDEAARKGGRSLNAEIVARLWQTLNWQDAPKHPYEMLGRARLMATLASGLTTHALELQNELEEAGRAGGAEIRRAEEHDQ